MGERHIPRVVYPPPYPGWYMTRVYHTHLGTQQGAPYPPRYTAGCTSLPLYTQQGAPLSRCTHTAGCTSLPVYIRQGALLYPCTYGRVHPSLTWYIQQGAPFSHLVYTAGCTSPLLQRGLSASLRGKRESCWEECLPFSQRVFKGGPGPLGRPFSSPRLFPFHCWAC